MRKRLLASPESRVDAVARKFGACIRANGGAAGAAPGRVNMPGNVNSRQRRGMRISRPDGFAGLGRLVSLGILRRSAEAGLRGLRVMVEPGMPV